MRTTLLVFAYSACAWGGMLALAGLPLQLTLPVAVVLGLGASAAVLVVVAGRES